MADTPTTASVEVRTSSSRDPTKWVNDWDLLSPGFQREATSYLQIVGVMVVVFLIFKRGRKPKKEEPKAALEPTGQASAPMATTNVDGAA